MRNIRDYSFTLRSYLDIIQPFPNLIKRDIKYLNPIIIVFVDKKRNKVGGVEPAISRLWAGDKNLYTSAETGPEDVEVLILNNIISTNIKQL